MNTVESLKARVVEAGARASLFGKQSFPTVGAGGRYRLEEILGQGGQGAVFRAHDLECREDVALKIIPIRGIDDDSTRRLEREFSALRTIPTHPNVVVYRRLEIEPAHCLLSMALLPGRPLEPGFDKGLLREALVEAAEALVHLHQHNLVHRDVKPSNLLLSRGHCVLVDCGLVRRPGEASDHSRITSTGHALGTPRFMAPEQGTPTQVGAAADVFSLCVTAWALLFDRDPYGGKSGLPRVAAIGRQQLDLPEDRAGRALADRLRPGLHPTPAARPSMLEIQALLKH